VRREKITTTALHMPFSLCLLLRFVRLSAVGAAFGMCTYQLGYQVATDHHFESCELRRKEDEFERKMRKEGRPEV